MTEWDGRPENPERDGWHWLMQDTLLYPARWDAAASAWHRSRFLTPHEITRLNDYCGPCLTPTEIERLRAALRELLGDTQHAAHACGDPDCPVDRARALLTEGAR